MKKLGLLAAVAVFAFGTVACKKEYTCSCTYSGTQTGTIEVKTGKMTKKDAKTFCEADNGTEDGITTSCSIK